MSVGRARIAAGYLVHPGSNTVHSKDCPVYDRSRGLSIMWGFAFSVDTACAVCLPDGLPVVVVDSDPAATSGLPVLPSISAPRPASVIPTPVPTALPFEQIGFEIPT